MTAGETHQRIKEAFAEARELSAAARGDFLADLDRRWPEIAREVRSLLEFDGSRDDLLEKGGPALFPADSAHRLAAGSRLAERYEILGHHATGGMGEVYRTHDHLLDTTVALKCLRFPSLQSKRRLVEEVLHARRVSHPAVCRVFDIGEAEGRLFLTMEFVGGDDLKTRLAQCGPLPEAGVLRMAGQLLRGLEAAHDAGVLHRDLKPANILFDTAGAVQLTDFGIAVSSSHADTTSVIGTPGYWAPEAVPPTPRFTERSDLYSLGLVLREALTGAPSFSAVDRPSLFTLLRHPSLAPIASVCPGLDPRLARVIDWSLMADWRQRASSARQLLAVLESDPARVETTPTLPAAAGRFEEISSLGGNEERRTRVWRAVDRLTGGVVAVKTYSEPACARDFLSQVDPARLAGQPNLLSVLDVIEFGDRTEVASPLLEGAAPLVDWAAERPFSERCEVLAQLYDGLAFLHARGQPHGNLRSSNVLVMERRTLLTDARSWRPRSATEAVAPPAFPEQVTADLAAARDLAEQALSCPSRRRVSAEQAAALLEQLRGSTEGGAPPAHAAAQLLRRRGSGPQGRGRAAHAAATGSGAKSTEDPRTFDTRPCVARDVEIGGIEALFELAAAGLGSILRLVGESGVGKTRLVEELRCRAWRRGMLVALTQAQQARSDAYSAWRMVVARLSLEVALSDEEIRILETVDPALGKRLGRPAATLDADVRPEALSQDILFPLVLDLMGRLPSAALVILEDLHWADGGSLELLHWLGERDLRCQVVILGTFRPEETSHHVDLSALETLELLPLDEHASHLLAASVVDPNRLTHEVKERLSREAEGNPLLLLEGLRELVDWAGSQPLNSAALEMPEPTPAVRDALTRRLEALDHEVSWLLLRAALIGRDIDQEVLSALVAPRMSAQAMHRAFDAARAAWVLVDQNDDTLRFRHDKLREILEARADAAELRQVHAGLARVLSQCGYPAAQVAFHALQSGDLELARKRCEGAGRQAMDKGSFLDAIGWLEKALKLRETLGDPLAPRGSVRHQLAICLYAIGQVPRSRQMLEQALGELGQQTLYGRRGPDLAFVADFCRLRSARRALKRGDAPADAARTEACHAYRLLSETCWFENDRVGMFGNAVRALLLAAETRAPSPAATSSAILAFLLESVPMVSSRPYIDLTLDLLDRAPATPDDVMAVGGIGAIFMARGEWPRAQELLDQAVEIGKNAGNERRWGQAAAYRCLLATLHCDWPTVRRIADALTESGQRRGDVQVESWGTTYLAEIALSEGRYERARTFARRARDLIAHLDPPERIRAEAQLAISNVHIGDRDEAGAWVRSGLRQFDGRVTTLHSHAATVHLAAACVELLAADRANHDLQATSRQAVKALEAFSRRYPMTRPYLELTRARLADIQGRTRRARTWLRKAERSARRLAFPAAIEAVARANPSAKARPSRRSAEERRGSSSLARPQSNLPG